MITLMLFIELVKQLGRTGLDPGMAGSYQVGENPSSRKLSKLIYTGGFLHPPGAIKTTLAASKANIQFELPIANYHLYFPSSL